MTTCTTGYILKNNNNAWGRGFHLIFFFRKKIGLVKGLNVNQRPKPYYINIEATPKNKIDEYTKAISDPKTAARWLGLLKAACRSSQEPV